MRDGVVVETGRRLLTWWDIRGRATRTQLLGFGMLLGCFGLLLGVLDLLLDLDVETDLEIGRALSLAVGLLWIPLFIRRLHDSGRSGAFLLVAAPVYAFTLQEKLRAFGHEWQPVHRPLWLNVALWASTLMFLVLLSWRGEEGPNRFGRDPRSGQSDAVQPA